MTFRDRLEKIVENANKKLNPFTFKEVAIFTSAAILAASLSGYGIYRKSSSDYKNKPSEYTQVLDAVKEQNTQIIKLKEEINNYKNDKPKLKHSSVNKRRRPKRQTPDLFKNAQDISIPTSKSPKIKQPKIPTYQPPVISYNQSTIERKIPETYTQPSKVITLEKKIPKQYAQPPKEKKVAQIPSRAESGCDLVIDYFHKSNIPKRPQDIGTIIKPQTFKPKECIANPYKINLPSLNKSQSIRIILDNGKYFTDNPQISLYNQEGTPVQLEEFLNPKYSVAGEESDAYLKNKVISFSLSPHNSLPSGYKFSIKTVVKNKAGKIEQENLEIIINNQ